MAGVQIIRENQRSTQTSQTTGMHREAAVAPETTNSQSLWMGLVTTPPQVVSGWHHHGDCESGIYIVSGRARFRWGPGGHEAAEVGPGDFLMVAPNAIHQEEAISDEPLVMVVSRGCTGVVVINTDEPEPAE